MRKYGAGVGRFANGDALPDYQDPHRRAGQDVRSQGVHFRGARVSMLGHFIHVDDWA
jgi:hypothetical protein